MGIQRNYSTRQISLILQFWRARSRPTESKAMRHLSRLAASGQTRVAESPSRLPRGALPWALVGDRWWLSDSTLRLSGATTPTASPGLSFTTCKANFRCADKGTSGWIHHESKDGWQRRTSAPVQAQWSCRGHSHRTCSHGVDGPWMPPSRRRCLRPRIMAGRACKC